MAWRPWGARPRLMWLRWAKHEPCRAAIASRVISVFLEIAREEGGLVVVNALR